MSLLRRTIFRGSHWLPLVVAGALAGVGLAGCGGASPEASRPPAFVSPAVCHHRTPAAAGECVKQQLAAEGVVPAAPSEGALGVHASQCVDVSRWNGYPDWREAYREGIRCAIVQTNDGTGAVNPLFDGQAAGAEAAGIKVGAYVFEENENAVAQADLLNAVARGHDVTLGAWVDTEVAGSYGRMCETVGQLRRLGWRIVGDYLSPGNSPFGYTCDTLVWPAEWGGSEAYPPSGWTYSSIKLRQWCGTCRMGGFEGEVDRDEDLGLLALASPPAPKPAPKPLTRQQMQAKYDHDGLMILRLRYLERVHHCLTPPKYGGGRYHRVCTVVWRPQGAAYHRDQKRLAAKGIS